MIRLLGFVFVLLVVISFIMFNLGNTSDLSLGFITFYDVPVFLSVLCAFLIGVLFAIPLSFSLGWKKRAAGKHKSKDKSPEKSPAADNTLQNEIAKENNSYGID